MFILGLGLGALIILCAIVYYSRQLPAGILDLDPLVRVYTPPGVEPLPATISGTVIEGILPRAAKAIKVPILLYHYVEYNHDPNDTIRMGLTVTPFWLERQLQFLRSNNYVTVSPAQLVAAVNSGRTLPPKSVMLTFDDGYRDFYTDAYPLLLKYKAKATIFVIPGFLDRPNFMYTRQLQEIATQSSGLITIGAHTVHHAALTSEKTTKAWDEVYGSKEGLEKIIGRKVEVFAYPYGFFNQETIKIVRRSGFTIAMSTIFGTTESRENLFYLPRIRVGNYAGEQFAARLK